MKRIIIGALVGGVIMFIASFIVFTFLPIGEMGIQSLPNEDAVIAAMRASISEPGFYRFPGLDMSGEMSKEAEKAWQTKYEAGPVGVLIYQPSGRPVFAPGQLATELIADILAAFLAAMIIAHVGGSYGGRVLDFIFFGLIAWLAVNISYWNWDGFPFAHVFAQGLDQVIGWGLAGLAMAAIIKPGVALHK